jgi:hypothetical protein
LSGSRAGGFPDRFLGSGASWPPDLFATPCAASLGIHGSPVGDAVEPARYGSGLPDGGGFGGEDQKSDLESVIGILFVMQNLPADRANQSTVTVDERGESLLVVTGDITLQELGVGLVLVCGEASHARK